MSRDASPRWHAVCQLDSAGAVSPCIIYVARGFLARLFGWHVLGPRQRCGALWLPSCSVVHGAGLRAPLDVAFLSRDGTVLALCVLRPWRVVRGPRGSCGTLESAQGSQKRWGFVRGCRLRWSAREVSS